MPVRLGLFDRTVDAYVSATLRKLGVRTRKEAVAQAEARGLGPAAEIEATRA